jgi:hypothetical protein
MTVRHTCTILITLGATGLVACAGEKGDATEPPFETAGSTLRSPPPTLATLTSSLPGVATWEVHASADRHDVMIVGNSDRGRQVVTTSLAYPSSPDTVAAVVFAADPSLGLDFAAVQASFLRDSQASSVGALAPQALYDPKASLLSCSNALLRKASALTCTGLACAQAIGSIAFDIPADPICLVCGVWVAGEFIVDHLAC